MIKDTSLSRSHWLVSLAAISAALLSAHAFAASRSDEPMSVKVHYADLDLSKPAGAEALYGRIKVAARKVCQGPPNPLELHRYSIWNKCYTTAVTNAVASVGSPRLTDLHESSHKKYS